MLNSDNPPMTHCPHCGADFTAPQTDKNQTELPLGAQKGAVSPLELLRELHPEVYEDREGKRDDLSHPYFLEDEPLADPEE